MIDPTKKVANTEEGNPFISLKNILGDEEFSSIAIEELATAIEAHGIYTYDPFDRLVLCKLDSEQVHEVMTLLRKVKFHDPNYNEEHGIREYDPHPLDDIINENFGKYPSEPQAYPSRYNYFGWLETDLPATLFIVPNQSEANTANQEPVKVAKPIIKNEPTHDPSFTDGIAGIFILNKDDAIENIKKWRRFAQDAVKSGLDAYRTTVGKGKAQSKFDPAGVGEWLVNNSEMTQAEVNKCLRKSLPQRSIDLAYLYEN